MPGEGRAVPLFHSMVRWKFWSAAEPHLLKQDGPVPLRAQDLESPKT